jgi:hypothetical protein
MRDLMLIVTLLCAAASHCAAATAPTTRGAAETGTFTTKFSDRSPLSAPAELRKRVGPSAAAAGGFDYDLAQVPFLVHVPPDYDPLHPHGVVFLLNFGPTKDAPAPWLPLLAQKKLIFIAAEPNAQPAATRAGLALDAIHNLKRLYAIDESRLFLIGLYQRDNSHELTALACGDIFTGTFIYTPALIHDVGEGSAFHRAVLSPPPISLIAKRRPLVVSFLDLNDYASLVKKSFELSGFQTVKLLRVTPQELMYPQLATGWFEQALAIFDAAAGDVQSKKPPATSAPSSVRAPATEPAAAPSTTKPVETEAARLLKMAESYISAGSYANARTRLKTIIEKYPASPEVDRAKALLKQIEGR